ncbi:Rab GTPase-activating protein 1-like [Tetrabaena socialis]|uniref:Rab GTPase-activating protein 1-like n=1 Tax=Tetrabaena socialis TaxID=47790 RepID=A0A2J8ACB0_9CHLO|nr:Rab GTPase-activating protein 1-like [Tetrabaena socialis]|eukprot:PNH10162.1 Rab GTPase-activating protein 1-like [Tetrabaena socialis]
MANEGISVPARIKDFVTGQVKERFLGLLSSLRPNGAPRILIEDETEVYLQVGRNVWHAPRQLRVELWMSSLARRASLVDEYQKYLAQDIAREAAVDIDKDVQRTFPNTRRFHSEDGQAQLRSVLRAYAAYDPEVAYCQGMNFIAGLLLMYLPSEAHAFAALVVLMEDRKLRSFYHRSMALLQVQLWQLSRLISPALNQHLEALGVVPMLYGASWLMTAFSADFPIPFSARIMDVMLGDQCECALLKASGGSFLNREGWVGNMNSSAFISTHEQPGRGTPVQPRRLARVRGRGAEGASDARQGGGGREANGH